MNIEKFSKKAMQYVKGRPSYPTVVLDYIKPLIPVGATIADVGAGTGKFTELIAQAEYKIFAVEPNEEMYAQLKMILAQYPKANPVLATSEKTTLADESIDFITVAQALHWFDLEKFKAECKRILKPSGWVVALYNNVVPLHDDQAALTTNAKHRIDAASQFFTHPLVKEFETLITYTSESWFSFMMSHSHSPLPSDDNYLAYVEKINAIFDKEREGELMHRKMITTVYAQKFT